jgi:two-component system chemotaxis response regulator CheB
MRKGLNFAAPGPEGLVVALGASTGGTQSTARILRALPDNFPALLIVQHMPPTFTRMYAENLDKECALSVKEARDGDPVRPGQVLIAPGDAHMRLVRRSDGYQVTCAKGAKVNGHCPAVDELFFSVAEYAGPRALGVILTGMGDDGARGLCAMRRNGAYTIGQDEATCVVYGMPREAYERGGVVRQAPLNQIPNLLLQHCLAMR